jgi:hypothetical protein
LLANSARGEVIIQCVEPTTWGEIEFRAIAAKLKVIEPLEGISSQPANQFARGPGGAAVRTLQAILGRPPRRSLVERTESSPVDRAKGVDAVKWPNWGATTAKCSGAVRRL